MAVKESDRSLFISQLLEGLNKTTRHSVNLNLGIENQQGNYKVTKQQFRFHETAVSVSYFVNQCLFGYLISCLSISHCVMSGLAADNDVYVNILTLNSGRNILFSLQVRPKTNFVYDS
jgi:hypothetical protein